VLRNSYNIRGKKKTQQELRGESKERVKNGGKTIQNL